MNWFNPTDPVHDCIPTGVHKPQAYRIQPEAAHLKQQKNPLHIIAPPWNLQPCPKVLYLNLTHNKPATTTH